MISNWNNDEILCSNLLTRPKPQLGTILVTGATGYVGGRLVPELLERGYHVRVMTRGTADECKLRWPEAEVVVADALDPPQLDDALRGVHTAYYLIHSLLLGPKIFASVDLRAAVNFRKAAQKMGIKRIIYLGALGNIETILSQHLKSRKQVAEELKAGSVPVTVLRAAVIIGSGSASYEILHHLIKRSPLFLTPFWAQTRSQPIGIRNLINVMVGVLETDETTGRSYDVGGKDILTYENMLRNMAEVMGKKCYFIKSAFANTHVYAYVASLLTPVPATIIRSLLESCYNEVICNPANLPPDQMYRPISYKEAILRAMSRVEQDKVHSRWTDEYPRAHELAIKLHELLPPPYYISRYGLITHKKAADLFKAISQIGGKDGWFHANWMWRLRGFLDQMLMGVGGARGRRSDSSLRINDVVGFWRVEDVKINYRLLLRAEMKLPGLAWLEFLIEQHPMGNKLNVIAYFEPTGLPGKLYWYNFLPFHRFIFTNLLKQIVKRS